MKEADKYRNNIYFQHFMEEAEEKENKKDMVKELEDIEKKFPELKELVKKYPCKRTTDLAVDEACYDCPFLVRRLPGEYPDCLANALYSDIMEVRLNIKRIEGPDINWELNGEYYKIALGEPERHDRITTYSAFLGARVKPSMEYHWCSPKIATSWDYNPNEYFFHDHLDEGWWHAMYNRQYFWGEKVTPSDGSEPYYLLGGERNPRGKGWKLGDYIRTVPEKTWYACIKWLKEKIEK